MLARERFAWVWMTSLIGVLGGYFFALRSLDAAALGHAQQIGLLAAALGSLGVIALLTRLLIRDRGEDAGVDERDRLIEHKGAAAAYYVLVAGMILVGCVMPFGATGWKIVHAAVLAIAVAEIVHYGMVIVGYRAGWRA